MSATNRGAIRSTNDFYATPSYTLDVLTRQIKWKGVTSFLEPCKGDGSIYNPVSELIPSSDKILDYCEISEDIDYLTFEPEIQYDLIITNPPFSAAESFLRKSIKESKCVCYLLRLNFLGSAKRKDLWKEVGSPNKLLVLSKRPSFTGKGSDATEYAWFCWDKNNTLKIKNGIHII